jgi:hypothetical protein
MGDLFVCHGAKVKVLLYAGPLPRAGDVIVELTKVINR